MPRARGRRHGGSGTDGHCWTLRMDWTWPVCAWEPHSRTCLYSPARLSLSRRYWKPRYPGYCEQTHLQQSRERRRRLRAGSTAKRPALQALSSGQGDGNCQSILGSGACPRRRVLAGCKPPGYSRAGADEEGAHSAAAPAQGGQRGAVVAQLPPLALEVLLLEEHQPAAPVVLPPRGAWRWHGRPARPPGQWPAVGSGDQPSGGGPGWGHSQRRRWGGRSTSSPRGRRCCRSTPPSTGTRRAPARTAAPGSRSARSLPTCQGQEGGVRPPWHPPPR